MGPSNYGLNPLNQELNETFPLYTVSVWYLGHKNKSNQMCLKAQWGTIKGVKLKGLLHKHGPWNAQWTEPGDLSFREQ